MKLDLTPRYHPKNWVDRFWKHVRKTEECWVWTAYLDKYGYGMFSASPKIVLSHRASWILHFGPIPTGMHVCHHCDNPRCVRPDHLWLGNPATNALDKVAKGRSSRSNAKLTPSQVLEIRSRPQYYGINADLARQYGVAAGTIWNARHRVNWKQLPENQDAS